VGCPLGRAVGLLLLLLGLEVGCDDGAPVGCLEGCPVGLFATVGLGEGFTVGAALGALLGKGVYGQPRKPDETDSALPSGTKAWKMLEHLVVAPNPPRSVGTLNLIVTKEPSDEAKEPLTTGASTASLRLFIDTEKTPSWSRKNSPAEAPSREKLNPRVPVSDPARAKSRVVACG
jgi:hypothetical protein